MNYLEEIGVCPIAQGWEDIIAAGDTFHYRILLGRLAYQNVMNETAWYTNQVIELFTRLLETYAGTAVQDWIVYQADLGKQGHVGEIYCINLNWLVQFKLTDHRPDEVLGHIIRIERRIRAV